MTEATKFEKGDVVRLKSSGPAMTITNQRPDGSYVAKWWNGSKYEVAAFEGFELRETSPDHKS